MLDLANIKWIKELTEPLLYFALGLTLVIISSTLLLSYRTSTSLYIKLTPKLQYNTMCQNSTRPHIKHEWIWDRGSWSRFCHSKHERQAKSIRARNCWHKAQARLDTGSKKNCGEIKLFLRYFITKTLYCYHFRKI